MPDAKRFVLFLIGTAMLINIVVEILVVRGDIGRMNTVFKFYLQGWALLSVCGGGRICMAAARAADMASGLAQRLPGGRGRAAGRRGALHHLCQPWTRSRTAWLTACR